MEIRFEAGLSLVEAPRKKLFLWLLIASTIISLQLEKLILSYVPVSDPVRCYISTELIIRFSFHFSDW